MRLDVVLSVTIASAAIFALQSPTLRAAEPPSDAQNTHQQQATTAPQARSGSASSSEGTLKQERNASDTTGDASDVGIYIAPQVNVASMVDDTGVLVGGRMAFVFDGTVSFGGGGVRLVNDLELGNVLEDGADRHLEMTYGGAILGATPWTDAPLHPTLDLMIGGGRIKFSDLSRPRPTDGFFVMEATAGLEWTIVQGIRLNVSGGYRHTAGAELQGITDEDLRGAVGMATLRFGAF